MSATADLRAEHTGVERMLRIIDRMSEAAGTGAATVADDLERVIEFLRVFVDTCHHAKEEDLLFPAMRAAGIPSVEDVLTGLLDDHARGRKAVRRLADLLPLVKDGDASVEAELAAVMAEYTGLLRAHILREESDCFDIADRELPSEVQRDLEAGYDRIEAEVVGGGVHEAFHALLDRLEATAAEGTAS